MIPLEPGQAVRFAPVPADLHSAVDTGTVIRMQRMHDPVTGIDGDSTHWLIDIDLTHFERAIPQAHLSRIDPE